MPSLALQHDIAKAGGKEALERHWDNWIGEDDWKWIVEKGFNTVRLPVSSGTIYTQRWRGKIADQATSDLHADRILSPLEPKRLSGLLEKDGF